MKFHCFNLMSWPYLPDDFVEKYGSSWIDARATELFDGRLGHQVYNDCLDILVAADKAGYDSVGVNEHHMNVYGLMPSPNLMASILARQTTQAKLLVLGNSVALYNPPIRVAEEMGLIDVLSNGRLIAGFPIGTAMDSVFTYGQNPATLREKYHEAVDLILKAWEAPEPFAWNGKYTQLPYVSLWPRPIQSPPPVWIPGGGSMEVWEWCIQNDFLYAYLSFFGLERSRATLEGYWETVDGLGAEPNPYRTAIVQFMAVADSDAEAERLYGRHAEYFYNRCLHIDPSYGEPAGYITVPTLRRNLARGGRGGSSGPSYITWKHIVENGWVVAGTAEAVAQRLGETIAKANVAHIIVQPQFGSLPKETAMYNMHRIAQDVIPVLRPRYQDWEDRWWPKDPPEADTSPAAGSAGQGTASAAGARR